MKRLFLLYKLVMLSCLQIWGQSAEEIYRRLQDIGIIDQKVMMPMRDGIRLATDIYRPKGDLRVPVIFSKTPYNFNSWGDGEHKLNSYYEAYEAVKRGYAFVVQNERGKKILPLVS